MLSRHVYSSLARNVRNSGRTINFQRNTVTAKVTSNYFSTTCARKETFTVQDEEQFKSKIMAEGVSPTIVDFSATWCGPCKLLTPRLDAAIAATEGKVNLALVDIDNLSDLALDYDVQAVPTVLAVKDGKVVDKFIGLIDEDKLGAFVNKLM